MPSTSIPRFTAGEVSDKILAPVFSRLERTLEVILGKQIIDGNLVSATLTSGVNKVPHNLKRRYNSFFLTQRYSVAGTTVVEVLSSSDADTFITLNASAAVNVNIWIF